jgi:hypothetical protein
MIEKIREGFDSEMKVGFPEVTLKDYKDIEDKKMKIYRLMMYNTKKTDSATQKCVDEILDNEIFRGLKN